jgi:HEAT repeat protein
MIWPFNNLKEPEILIKELENPDPAIKEQAFKDLKDHPDDHADELILKALKYYDETQKDLLLPLIDIAGARQIDGCIAVLKNIGKSDDFQIKETVIQALAGIPTQESLDALFLFLRDSDPAIKQLLHNIIIKDYGEEALGALLRAVPEDKKDPLYFEIVSIMEELDLFTRLKENFDHPDYRVKDFNFDSLSKFHRPDFIPLYLDFYGQATAERKNKIIEILSDYSPVELIPYFKQSFKRNIQEPVINLAERLVFGRFKQAKEEILNFAISISDNHYRTRIIKPLIQQLDPYVFFTAFKLLDDSVADIRKLAHEALKKIIKNTYTRLYSQNEPNKATLSKFYEQWERHISSLLKEKNLSPDKRKDIRRLFYCLAENKHHLIRPHLRDFFSNNFHETYFIIKDWDFDEQFELFKDIVTKDPSFASLLLTAAQGNLDENIWRIILKLITYLDEEDKEAFRKNLLSRNRSISLDKFIKDDDPSVRVAAIDFAAELKINGLIDLLKKSTNDPDCQVRLKALECLGRQNYPQIRDYLVEALSDPEEDVAFYALKELKQMLSPGKIAPYLARFINSSSKKIREFALKEIAEISKKRYKANFNNLKPEVRKLAAKVIQKIDNSFSDQIIQDLSSLDPQVRLQSARLLENIQIDENGKDALLAAMKDPSKLVRAAVVKTLGVLGDSNLIKQLVSFFNDPDLRVRANTIEAISSLGDRQAIQILLPFLEDSNNRIRANAVVGIKKIGNINIFPVLQKMLKDKNPNMQASALWAIGEVGDENYLNFLYPYLNNRNEMLRYNAVRSISRIKPEILRPYMVNLRKDPSKKIRKIIANLSYKVI